MRAKIYDLLFHRLSKGWYREVLERLPRQGQLLDVGVGTGSSLLGNHALLRERELRVLGIDINVSYLRAAQQRAQAEGLAEQVALREQSVYDLDGERFDAVYFSASFMLLPDQLSALQVVQRQLREGGKIYFTQTFEKKKNRLMELIKPLLYRITTVHFGVVTYEAPFLALLQEAGLELCENCVLSSSARREVRLISAARSGAHSDAI